MPCKPDHCKNKGDCASVACKSTFPRHEYLPESFPATQIIVWLIEQTMTQTGTHNRSDKQRVEKRIKKLYRHTLSLEEPLEDIPSEDKS